MTRNEKRGIGIGDHQPGVHEKAIDVGFKLEFPWVPSKSGTLCKGSHSLQQQCRTPILRIKWPQLNSTVDSLLPKVIHNLNAIC